MEFKEVIGQQEVKLHLSEMVEQNRLSHALLFLGNEGSGALPLAIAFAQYLVCEKVNRKPADPNALSIFELPEPIAVEWLRDSCGTCSSCTKAASLMHPDIHFSYPVITRKSGDKPLSGHFAAEWREFYKQLPYGNVYDWLQFVGAENKQGNISAEECNEILQQMSLKSFESGYKILLMWMPEYLGKEGNKLLKLIEEPPPNTIFILVAESEEQILQTILSRTQLVKIPLLSNDEIEDALVRRNNTAPEQARQVAAIAEGNYHEALHLLQHSEEDWQGLLRDWLNATLKAGPAAQVKWVAGIAELGREKQKQFLRYFNHLLEQSIRIRVMGADRVQLVENEKDFAIRLNKIAGVHQQQAIIEELDKACYFIERNANGKMLFHALTIKLLHIIQDKVLVST